MDKKPEIGPNLAGTLEWLFLLAFIAVMVMVCEGCGNPRHINGSLEQVPDMTPIFKGGLNTTSSVNDFSGAQIYLCNMWDTRNVFEPVGGNALMPARMTGATNDDWPSHWYQTYYAPTDEHPNGEHRGFYQPPPLGYVVIRMWQTGFYVRPVHADSVSVITMRERDSGNGYQSIEDWKLENRSWWRKALSTVKGWVS